MRSTKFLSLSVAGLLFAGSAVATTARKVDSSAHTLSTTQDRTGYINSVEKSLASYDAQITKMKTERDRQASNSDRYKELNKRVGDMEEASKDVRENLSELRNASSDKWVGYQNDISEDLAELDKASKGLAD